MAPCVLTDVYTVMSPLPQSRVEYFHYYSHFCNRHSNKHCREKFPENNEMRAEDSESNEGPSAVFVAVPVGYRAEAFCLFC